MSILWTMKNARSIDPLCQFNVFRFTRVDPADDLVIDTPCSLCLIPDEPECDSEEFLESGTFVLPVDAEVTIEAWGKGGNGGTADHLAGYGGGGGGGGAYAKGVMNLTAGSYAVVIDATGSSFIDTGTLLAGAGADGTDAEPGGFGGAGGTPSGSALDVGYAGGDGGEGDLDVNDGLGGGGGSSAGTGAAGDDGESGETSTGAGGTAPSGGGNGGNGAGVGGNPPVAGATPGGGGGGGGDVAAGIPAIGGGGKVLITWCA